jgi:hypothetical protein
LLSEKEEGLSMLREDLEDVKAGRVSEYASVDDFFKEMGL